MTSVKEECNRRTSRSHYKETDVPLPSPVTLSYKVCLRDYFSLRLFFTEKRQEIEDYPYFVYDYPSSLITYSSLIFTSCICVSSLWSLFDLHCYIFSSERFSSFTG